MQKDHLPDDAGGGCYGSPDSFGMNDPGCVFESVGLRRGQIFLDLGCWPGDYSMTAAEIVGPSGRVYALEIWRFMVELLEAEAQYRGLVNLQTLLVDITADLPLPDHSVDICLIPNMVNLFRDPRAIPGIIVEIRRVLKPGGRLAIIGNTENEAFSGPPGGASSLPGGFRIHADGNRVSQSGGSCVGTYIPYLFRAMRSKNEER